MASTPTVIAFHGGGMDPSFWDEVRSLAPELSFVAPHLAEEAMAAAGSGTTLMDRLEALVPQGPCIFTGVSLGTLFAVELAARAGDRTRGVLLISGGPRVEDEPWLQKVRGMLGFMSEAFDPNFVPSLANVLVYRGNPRFAQLSQEVAASILRESGRRLVPLARAIESRPRLTHDAVALITAPVHVWFGQYDPSIEAEFTATWSQVAQVTRVPAVAHEIPLEAPEVVAAELMRLARGA